MEQPDIENLAHLSRLELTAEEKERYGRELADILAYVEHVQEVAGDESLVPEYDETPVKNVLRQDSEPHESGEYTDALLDDAPDTKDGYIKVKKIL